MSHADFRNTTQCLLDDLAVALKAHGSGLGHLMPEVAERAATEAGYGAVKLYINEPTTADIVPMVPGSSTPEIGIRFGDVCGPA